MAKKAGVSEATVSRVLNGRAGVSEATRTSVLTALDVLGYERPSKLRGERARLVGLVLPELQNPIFPAFAEAVTAALVQRGYSPVLCARTVGGVSEVDFVQMLLEHQVSGIIFAGGNYAMADASHDHYRGLAERGLPVVLVNGGVEQLGLVTVSTDDAVAVEQAYAHLISLGHTRIGALLGPADHIPSRRKLAALDAAVAAYRKGSAPQKGSASKGAAPDKDGAPAAGYVVERSTFSMEGARVAATRLAQQGVTGMLCASDVLALGAIRAVRRLGLRVPQDMSIVGFDDSAFMTCTDPPLTTVRQPIDAMGQAVVDLLVQQVDGTGVAPAELLFEPELVVRGSTAAAPRP